VITKRFDHVIDGPIPHHHGLRGSEHISPKRLSRICGDAEGEVVVAYQIKLIEVSELNLPR
jgi:hypothetical protein